MPEVDALVAFLRERAVGTVVAEIEVASISVLKTFDPPVTAFRGLTVTGVSRHGKFIDFDVDGVHLVVHLARAGWLRWSDNLAQTRLKLGNGPIALRVRLDAGTSTSSGRGGMPGFDLTEAGTRKGLAVYAVRDPQDVPGIASLGPDPLTEGFSIEPLLTGRRMQIKRLLRDQGTVAGIGNAYSDEILHAARLSPVTHAAVLDDDARARLYAATTTTVRGAIEARRGIPIDRLKAAKVAAMQVHGRAGESCPVCGDTIRDLSFASTTAQYCPTCQTGGRILKDRRLSRLLR